MIIQNFKSIVITRNSIKKFSIIKKINLRIHLLRRLNLLLFCQIRRNSFQSTFRIF